MLGTPTPRCRFVRHRLVIQRATDIVVGDVEVSILVYDLSLGWWFEVSRTEVVRRYDGERTRRIVVEMTTLVLFRRLVPWCRRLRLGNLRRNIVLVVDEHLVQRRNVRSLLTIFVRSVPPQQIVAAPRSGTASRPLYPTHHTSLARTVSTVDPGLRSAVLVTKCVGIIIL